MGTQTPTKPLAAPGKMRIILEDGSAEEYDYCTFWMCYAINHMTRYLRPGERVFPAVRDYELSGRDY